MANNRSKAVDTLVDNWTRGADIRSFLTNKGSVVKKGDSVDIPSSSAVTINHTETAARQTLTLTPDTMTVDRTKFANVELLNLDDLQLMDGAAQDAYLMKMLGDLKNDIVRDIVEHLIRDIAGASAANHVNLAADAIAEADVNEIEALILEQAGVDRDRLFWFSAPRCIGSLKNVADYVPADPLAAAHLGIPMVRSINGYPSLDSSLVPGGEDAYRLSVATTAVTVSSNVATATVTVPTGSSRHGFVAGQQIWTSGLTTDVAVTAPATITSVDATHIVYPLTASNGALADGIGTIYSASSMGLLVNGAKAFYAFQGLIPQYYQVKIQGGAGWELQLVTHMARQALSGSIKVIHAPD